MWKDSQSISAELDTWRDDDVLKLRRLFDLSRVLRGSLFVSSMDAYSEIISSIKPSIEAQDIIQKDIGLSQSSFSVIKLACFISFYHHDFMFDFSAADIKGIGDGIAKCVANGSIFLTSGFGRDLYDRFATAFPETRKDSLEFDEVMQVINGAPQGVAQCGEFLIGPAGLIESETTRMAPPTTYVPLWHCSDVGCGHLHNVHLRGPHPELRDAIERIDDVARNYFGPPSHWGTVISHLSSVDYSLTYGDLFAFVHEGLSARERKLLLIDLLKNSNSKRHLWDLLKSDRLKLSAKEPSQLVHSLSDSSVTQLILACDDSSIVNSIDSLTWSEIIEVPPTEIRRARHRQSSGAFVESFCSLSALGLRTLSISPISELAIAIWEAYDESDRLGDLSWRTERLGSPASPGTVMKYLNDHSPNQAVTDLIINTKDVLEIISDQIGLHDYESVSRDQLVPRLLWKLGFDVPRVSNSFLELNRHLETFKIALLSRSEPLSSTDREQIRSAGVNLFVELESCLESLISYNLWMLSNDHFIDKFVFRPSRAVSEVESAVAPFGHGNWNRDGGNTLGVLLSYLSSASQWIEALTKTPPSSTRRNSREYPHYADEESDLFPFHYKEFWANCSSDEIALLSRQFKEIATLILQSDAAGVRNGLDHFRKADAFPRLDTMLACEARLRQAFELADLRRFMPKRWWLSERTTNSFGQVWERFSDEQGLQLEARYPSVLTGIAEGYFGHAVVAPSGNLLGQANATILFRVVEESDYDELWSSYPARPIERIEDEATAIEDTTADS